MAKDFLAIPATSVPSEQVFSIAGQILTKCRSALTENKMNALMCCKSWLEVHGITKEELVQEANLLAEMQELGVDGDVESEL